MTQAAAKSLPPLDLNAVDTVEWTASCGTQRHTQPPISLGPWFALPFHEIALVFCRLTAGSTRPRFALAMSLENKYNTTQGIDRKGEREKWKSVAGLFLLWGFSRQVFRTHRWTGQQEADNPCDGGPVLLC